MLSEILVVTTRDTISRLCDFGEVTEIANVDAYMAIGYTGDLPGMPNTAVSSLI